MKYYQDSTGFLYYQFGTDNTFYSRNSILDYYMFCVPPEIPYRISYKKAILLGHDK